MNRIPISYVVALIVYIVWLAFLAWLVNYFDSAMPLRLLIVSPAVEFESGTGETQEGEANAD